jgi:hypothetical protein
MTTHDNACLMLFLVPENCLRCTVLCCRDYPAHSFVAFCPNSKAMGCNCLIRHKCIQFSLTNPIQIDRVANVDGFKISQLRFMLYTCHRHKARGTNRIVASVFVMPVMEFRLSKHCALLPLLGLGLVAGS